MRRAMISYSVGLSIEGKKLATSSFSAHAARLPFAVACARKRISRSLAASVPLPMRQAKESWMNIGSKTRSWCPTSRWCTTRSRKSAANTSRGFGPSVTKQIERPGR